MTKIKICGLKRLQDIEYVNELLPDFIGFVFAGTKRKITDEKAKEFKTVLNPRIKAVGVFVNDTLEHISFLANNNIIDIIQLHGDEDKEYIENLRKITNKQIIKAVRVKNSQSVIETKKIKADYLLLDTFSDSGEYGGTANPDRNIAAALAAGCWRDMTRVSLTDPDRTRAMVEEDSLNVEALLRRMAARLTDMADQLHAGAAGEQDVMGFFAEGDPFRRYKAAVTHAGITAAQDGTATAAPQAGTTAAGFPERELAVPEAGWQQTLLFSARRGEAITGFVHPRQAIIQLRPAM